MVYGQPVDLSILHNAQKVYAMTIKNLIGQMANSTLKVFDLTLIKMEQAAAARTAGQVNNGAYWDNYVRQWEELDENRLLEHVGNEWKNEEIFLSLLEKYASPESSAIEIGCGGERITSKATRWVKHVYACDVSKEMLRKNRESVRESNVSYHMLDGFTLGDFADESLDFVFSHDVFVHFSSLRGLVYPSRNGVIQRGERRCGR
jgi:2-polyprenyl-3-methyl-5-hydroxy-6-metoxy-1,4-benzoquinol methylase